MTTLTVLLKMEPKGYAACTSPADDTAAAASLHSPVSHAWGQPPSWELPWELPQRPLHAQPAWLRAGAWLQAKQSKRESSRSVARCVATQPRGPCMACPVPSLQHFLLHQPATQLPQAREERVAREDILGAALGRLALNYYCTAWMKTIEARNSCSIADLVRSKPSVPKPAGCQDSTPV